MIGPPEKRNSAGGALESTATSMNSSALRMEARAPGGETALQRVAALGMAVLHIHHGADRAGPLGRGGPVAEVLADPSHQVQPQDALAGRLAGDLLHIRDSRQFGLLPRAIEDFACWCTFRRQFTDEARFPDRSRLAQLLPKYSGRTIHEWLSDRCIACGGSGTLERAAGGSWVKPLGRGWIPRNTAFRVCTSCHGSRRCTPSHTARRMAIGISIKDYELEAWGQHFNAGLTWLTNVVYRRLTRPLTVQLERSKKRV